MYCRRIGILPCTIPTLVLPEHVQGHEVRQEFLAELALAIPPELACAISPELAHAIPPELAPSLVLARSLASPDLVGALDGGHPPLPCSLYYLGFPTYELMEAAVDQNFPLHGKEGSNKMNTIISDHNRKGYQ